MIITRRGKCAECSQPTKDHKEFIITLNMFDPDSTGITPEIRKQIIAWRESPILCLTHQGAKVGVTA